MQPFDVLLETEPASSGVTDLDSVYGGGVRLGTPLLFANFVQTIDGIVSLGATPSAGSIISGHNIGDRFLMGLLRASADAVLIGAGTLRGSPGHRWTADHVFPDAAASFAELRRRAGRPPQPTLVVLTAAGRIEGDHAGLRDGALVLTTHAGAPVVRRTVPDSCEVVGCGDGETLDVAITLEVLRARGLAVILSEAGPSVTGQLLRRQLLDELFLTVSPVIAGRDRGYDRLSLGSAVLPGDGAWSDLLSVRRHGSHLFLRYRISQR